ncbi:hypothetical protein KSF78_0006092 [Schistosoma japonicum]|uniref:SJCHGC04668 protein n=1 Tax=Schistosoma japonicum TaxID=6182 RepID=Q5D9L7_SCHJA|nr:SJCHGC04668 protein [Schistosoma japonicum]KAH8871051.1 hypothetical protein KSF78_0006092 [Schistosoma japonicum]CAX74196.1 hypothetical protein [Schistosoma japonicum]
MLATPIGSSVQKNVKIKSVYQALGILIGICFDVFYITKHNVETAVCCSFSILFASVGLYVDIQLLRGHWRVWPCILRRYMMLGILGSIISFSVLLGSVYYEIRRHQMSSFQSVLWCLLSLHWSTILAWASYKYHVLLTDVYTLSKGHN